METATKNRQNIGDKIKKLRIAHGKTQLDLAMDLGYDSSGTISLIENNFKGMSLPRLVETARIFSVPIDVLINDRDYSKDDLALIAKFIGQVEKHPDQRSTVFAAIIELLKLVNLTEK